MEYQTRVTSSAELFGAMETSDFSILASGKAFSVLIDGLYADKIWSIVREACANAYDGHVRAGNTDRPFEVHCPNRWEPFFHVRDHGCSMDHEFVMKLYTTLFYSMKDESNEESGCFGLGSKAPFAYTTTFTVTAWKDGERRVYTAYIDNDDRPRMVLNDCSPSDEDRGIMVSFAVQARDFFAFEKAIQRAALGYDVPFECAGVHLPKLEYRERHGTYDIVSSGLIGSGPFVRIGPVLYPLDSENETALFAFDKKNPKIRTLLERGDDLILNVPISGGAVTPSRESLSYTPKMVDDLADHLDLICRNAEAKIAALFAPSATVWEYAMAYSSALGNSNLSSYESLLLGDFLTPFGAAETLNSMRCPHGMSPGGVFEIAPDYSRSREPDTLHRDANYIAVLQDSNVSMMFGRVRHYLKKNNYRKAYVFKRFDPLTVLKETAKSYNKSDRATRKLKLNGLLDRLRKARAKIDEAIKEFGCPIVVDITTLDRPPKETKGLVEPAVYRLIKTDGWEPVGLGHFDEDLPTLIFPLDRREFKEIKLPKIPPVLLDHLKLLGLNYKQIVGVARTRVPVLLKFRPEWQVYSDVLVNKLDASLLLQAVEALDFISWSSDRDRWVRQKQTLEMALSMCNPAMAWHFVDYFTLVKEIVDKRKSYCALRDGLVSAQLFSHKSSLDSSACSWLLAALGITVPRDPPPEHDRMTAASAAIAKTFPEITEALDGLSSQPEMLAAYLAGRQHITTRPAEAEPDLEAQAA